VDDADVCAYQFVVSLKHHLRGELGIYYEDLYDIVKSELKSSSVCVSSPIAVRGKRKTC
jgi:hypothetical protein